MIQLIKSMFGTGDAAGKLVDNLASGLDKLWYSPQEQSQDEAKSRSEANTVYMEWLRSTSGSRVARRFIAVTVTLIWSMQYVASMVLGIIAPWVQEATSSKLLESAAFLSTNGEQANAAFMVVLGFYFLGNKADEMFKSAVEKFTNRKGK